MEEIIMKKVLSATLASVASAAFLITGGSLIAAGASGESDTPKLPPVTGGSTTTPSESTSTPSESTSTPSESTSTPSESTSTPATSEPSTSTPAVEEVEFTVELTLGADGKLEGAALNDQLLVKDGVKCTWSQVESIKFTADGAFSVSFYADKSKVAKDIFVLGVDNVPDGRDDDAKWVTEATLTAAHVALFDSAKGENAVVLEAKDPSTKITADVKVLVEKPAQGNNGNTNNPGTGIALAVAPAGLAVAFVTVAAVMNKKKRG